MLREYLGDGVYVEQDGFQIWLITNDGYRDLSRIAIDRNVWENLKAYAKRFGYP
jgi:hypothetical protein